MNKKIIIGAVIILVAAIGIGLYFTSSNKSKSGSSDIQTPESKTSSPASLRELISSNIPQKCTYSFNNEESGVITEGQYYISDGRMSGEYKTQSQDKTIVMKTLFVDDTAYIWTEGEERGYKMSYDLTQDTEAETDTNEQIDFEEKFDYRCSPWIVSNEKFAIPDNIQFTDFSDTGDSESNQPDCSVCDDLTEESKTQCLNALNCN